MTLHNPRRLRHAIVSAGQCITSRHLFERIVSSVAEALEWSPPLLPPHDGLLQDSSGTAAISAGGPVRGVRRRCETLAQLNVELSRMLKYEDRGDGFRFVLVLDGLDKARDPPPTLVPAMARLSEIVHPPSSPTLPLP
jgi:origin recognition complex subunit 5